MYRTHEEGLPEPDWGHWFTHIPKVGLIFKCNETIYIRVLSSLRQALTSLLTYLNYIVSYRHVVLLTIESVNKFLAMQ